MYIYYGGSIIRDGPERGLPRSPTLPATDDNLPTFQKSSPNRKRYISHQPLDSTRTERYVSYLSEIQPESQTIHLRSSTTYPNRTINPTLFRSPYPVTDDISCIIHDLRGNSDVYTLRNPYPVAGDSFKFVRSKNRYSIEQMYPSQGNTSPLRKSHLRSDVQRSTGI